MRTTDAIKSKGSYEHVTLEELFAAVASDARGKGIYIVFDNMTAMMLTPDSDGVE